MSKLPAFFQAPVFEDEAQTRRARLLSFILNLHLVIAVSIGVFYLIFSPGSRLFPFAALVACLPAVGLRVLLRRGQVTWAAVLFLGFIAGLMPWVAWLTHSSVGTVTITAFQFVTIVMTGLLLGGQGVLGLVLFTCLVNGGLFYAEANGWYAVDAARNIPSIWVAQVITYSAAAALLGLANRLIQESFRRARRENDDRLAAEAALRQQADRLNLLHEIDQTILAAHSIEAIVQAALSRLERLVPNRRMGVILFDYAADEAAVVAAFTEGQIGHIGRRFPLRDFEITDAVRQGRAHVVNDLTGLAAPTPIEQSMLANGLRAYVDVPLVVGGDLIGVLGLDAIEPGTFRAELIEIVREVADQLAIAIQQSRLLAETQRHAAELEQRVADRTRELAVANERLTELDRLKSKFVSDVSHELRTPIANLKLYAGLLERGKPEKQAHYMAVIRQQAGRLAQLVDDILDLSRLEIMKEHVTFGPVDLNEVTEQVVTAQLPRAEAAGLRLTFERAEGLPSVRGEINQLAQVVTNLVANAINYTPRGSVRVAITREADAACLLVQDTGFGIEPADLAHVFDRFYRGRQPRQHDISGTGLGLAIVKEIVELHEGRIEVDSRVEHGTTFKVWLPVMG